MLTRVRPLAAAALAAAALATAAGPALAKSGGTPAIPLNTGQETTGSNTGASGFFSYSISGTQLCYTLAARNLSGNAGAAHIHKADRHVAGPILVPLMVDSGTTFTKSACTTASATLLADIATNPRAYYVNVHTALFPGGEIRGQLK